MERFVHAALYALIAVAAWTYARTNASHRVIALLFGWELVANTARLAIDPALDAAAPPYEGGVLVLYYLDHALVLSFRFALLGACLVHFERASVTFAAYAFAAVTLALVITKQATDVSLVPIHHAIAAATVAISWVLALRAVMAPAARLMSPDGAHAVLLLILAETLVKVSLHYFGPPQDTWTQVRWADLLVHGVIAIGYLGTIALRHGVLRWRA
jgi:hypothetical protein